MRVLFFFLFITISAAQDSAFEVYKKCPLRLEVDCPINKEQQDKLKISYFKCDINRDNKLDYAIRDEGEDLSKYLSHKLILSKKNEYIDPDIVLTHEKYCCLKFKDKSIFFGYDLNYMARVDFTYWKNNQIENIESNFNLKNHMKVYKEFINSNCFRTDLLNTIFENELSQIVK